MTNQPIDITIDERGKCREAGYGDLGAPGGRRTYTITSVGRTIHTCSGGPNFVFGRAERC